MTRCLETLFVVLSYGGYVNTRTRPGGDHLHDDNYPKDRSNGPELDPQEDLEGC